MSIVFGALVAVLWAVGTPLALNARRGQRFGSHGARLPMLTRYLWAICPLLLAIAAINFYGQPRDPARLIIALVIVLVLFVAVMLGPILVHNARLK